MVAVAPMDMKIRTKSLRHRFGLSPTEANNKLLSYSVVILLFNFQSTEPIDDTLTIPCISTAQIIKPDCLFKFFLREHHIFEAHIPEPKV